MGLNHGTKTRLYTDPGKTSVPLMATGPCLLTAGPFCHHRRISSSGLPADIRWIGPEPPFSRSTAKTRRAERPVAAFSRRGGV